MIKAVIDTNIFASGVFWKGAPYQVLQAWERKRFIWVVSAEILEEYHRVLVEMSSGRADIDVGRIVDVVSLGAELVRPVVFARPICTDSDDDKFLGAAIAAGASFVVSGDKALLKVGAYKQVQVVGAREFSRHLPRM
jgi:uncharacterized protein